MRYSTLKYTLLLLLVFFMGGEAFARTKAPMCAHIFMDPQVARIQSDFKVNTGNRRLYETPVELVQFTKIKTDLWNTLATLPDKRRGEVEHLLAAVEFFDYTHTAPQIFNKLFKEQSEPLNYEKLYDSYGEPAGAPFKGFLNARDNYLRKKKPPVAPETLLEIHRHIMKDGVERVSKDQLGVWRDGHWMGNAVGEWTLKPREIKTIEENPYLYFENRGEVRSSNSGEGLWSRLKIWGLHKNSVSYVQNEPRFQGRIHYPHVLTHKKETVEIIKKSHPEVYKEVMAARQLNKTDAVLEQKFSKALVEHRFQQFNRDREAIGEIKIGQNEQLYIDLVADFQRDLVAIHPVLNGNGRTTRLFMNYLLTKEGLPPVRLVDPFLDVQVSVSEWRQYVHKGVLNSAQLQADIAYRIQQGLTVESSPELIYPGLPELISISLKKQGSAKAVKDHAQVKLESEQFNAFILALAKDNPEIIALLKTERLQTLSRLADMFVDFQSSKTIRYIHSKDGEKDIKIRLIEPEFVESFAVLKSHDKDLWDAKIDRWYERDMLIWRGLSSRHHEYTIKELLNMFVEPSAHLASNSVAGSSRRNFLDNIKKNFELYNQEVLNGKIVEMATDHHREGPRYGNSYGFSTSKREVVGKAFAMGAMVIAEYGKHMDPALQAQLKSRVNVATYRSIKDIDLGRLKAFDDSFSYIYGRQAEVMGIGATDPDAVMLIQRLDAKGKVLETLMRNPQKPNEVLRIKGRYLPTEGPLSKDQIIEKYKI